MKLLFWFLTAGVSLALAAGADLSDIKTVYLLPMPSGLDQYLAIKLTTGVVLQVVTDPQKADAILSDHIGAGLEQKLDELYGAISKKDDGQDPAGQNARPAIQPLSRSKGTIFLVDRKTRNVLWSAYALPKNTAPAALDRLADRIVNRLEKDRKGR